MNRQLYSKVYNVENQWSIQRHDSWKNRNRTKKSHFRFSLTTSRI